MTARFVNEEPIVACVEFMRGKLLPLAIRAQIRYWLLLARIGKGNATLWPTSTHGFPLIDEVNRTW